MNKPCELYPMRRVNVSDSNVPLQSIDRLSVDPILSAFFYIWHQI